MVEIDLAGHTALVTGSSRGIGAAIALRLAEAGAAADQLERGDFRSHSRTPPSGHPGYFEHPPVRLANWRARRPTRPSCT